MNEVPALPPVVGQYFWLVVGLFWLFTTQMSGLSPARYARDREKGHALFKRLGVVFLGICVAMWAIQQSAGSGAGVFVTDWPMPQRWLGFGVMGLALLATIAWVFPGGGARTIAEAFGTSEGSAKAVVALLLVAGTLVNVYAVVAGGTPGG